MAIYLLLPWIRERLQERATRKPRRQDEQSAEEKIAHAREWMIRSLQAGIANSADDGDMEWIAYRRLMGGLKPVLPQTAAAVIAMNYHNEDLLLVEPKTAEPSFQMLLAQRALVAQEPEPFDGAAADRHRLHRPGRAARSRSCWP